MTAHCLLGCQTTVTSFRVGWNFSDGESIASAQDVFPSRGQLAALTLANSQARYSVPMLLRCWSCFSGHLPSESGQSTLPISLWAQSWFSYIRRLQMSCYHPQYSAAKLKASLSQQVVLQSGTNESNWLAPAGGQVGFTFTGEESANPPDPSNPYRVAVPEVCH